MCCQPRKKNPLCQRCCREQANSEFHLGNYTAAIALWHSMLGMLSFCGDIFYAFHARSYALQHLRRHAACGRNISLSLCDPAKALSPDHFCIAAATAMKMSCDGEAKAIARAGLGLFPEDAVLQQTLSNAVSPPLMVRTPHQQLQGRGTRVCTYVRFFR